MTFKLWADEQMSRPAGAPTPAGVPLARAEFEIGGARYVDFVYYFGSPESGYALQTAVNGGTDAVKLTPAEVMPLWQGQTDYAAQAVVADGAGMLHRCLTAGVSGESKPVWARQRGGRTADGAAVWQCMGAAHRASAVKLALSAAGLDSAQAGAALALGHTVQSGAAVAIYVRIENRVQDRYWALDVPQIGLNINDCVVVERTG